VMLYEMVVGQVPFNADTPFSIIHDHIYSPLPMPRAINPKVPEPVERVLLKALAKERADRYPDVNSLVQAFKDAWVEAGVPMQGTAITMRPAAIRAVAQTVPPPRSVARGTAPASATVVAKAEPAKRTSPWLFVAGAFVMLALLGVAGLVIFQSGLLGGLSGQLPTEMPPTLVAQATVAPVQVDATGTVAPVPTEALVPAVATARAAAVINPADPQIQLNLSLAYWDSGQKRPALVTLGKAGDLAGGKNSAFYQSAGDQFRQRQAWIPAAAMYVRAIKSLGPTGNPPAELVDEFHEAFYKASTEPDVSTYMSFDDLAVVEQPITLVAQARHLYYNGDTAKGHELLNQVRTLRPHMPEASLLEAEMDANEGKTFEAKQLLNILIGSLDTPNWVREMAQSLINKIP
jgi:hypothetical protein